MKLDHTKSAKVNLLTLVNQTNSTSIAEGDIDFGTPSVIAGASLPHDKTTANTNLAVNTKVTMTGKGNAAGSVEIQYRRISIRKQYQFRIGESTNPTLTVIKSKIPTFDESSIKSLLVSELKLIESSVDITVTINTGDNASATITAKENDLVYVADETAFMITVQRDDKIQLPEVITTTSLSGFEYDLEYAAKNGYTFSG